MLKLILIILLLFVVPFPISIPIIVIWLGWGIVKSILTTIAKLIKVIFRI